MNRRKILAIVLGGIAILGLSGGATLGVGATTASEAPADSADLTAVQDGDENETEQDTERIPITEAMEAAADETADRNGTVVGAEVGQTNGLLDFGDDDDESVYTVDVLLANGTHIEVAVNATNGSVVEQDEQEEGFLESIFGEDNVPDRPLNLSAMHNATEAVELAQNETVENESMNVSGENVTVTSVKLNDRDDNLVYEVEMQTGEDEEMTVVVDALKDGEGVIEVENGDGMGGGDEGSDDGGGDGGDGDGNESGDGGS